MTALEATILAIFNSLSSIIPIWRPGEAVRWNQHWCHPVYSREISWNIIFGYSFSVVRISLYHLSTINKSREGSVGIALSYGLDDRGSRVRFPAAAGNFSLHHRVQNGSGAHPASYPMDTRGSFSGGKAAGA
jgi:hypothetical protein